MWFTKHANTRLCGTLRVA